MQFQTIQAILHIGVVIVEYPFPHPFPGSGRKPLYDAVNLVWLVRGGPDLGDDDVAVEAAVELGAVALLPHEAVLLPVVQPVTGPTW